MLIAKIIVIIVTMVVIEIIETFINNVIETRGIRVIIYS